MKVVTALLTRGLIREQVTDSLTRADAAMSTAWRNEEDGRAVLLHITPAGLEAIGLAPAVGQQEPVPGGPVCDDAGRADKLAPSGNTGADEAAVAPAPDTRRPPQKEAPTAALRKTREGTKQAQLIAMLERAEGSTVEEIAAATGWQPHTVRGAFAGSLKRKLGLTVTSEKVDGIGRD